MRTSIFTKVLGDRTLHDACEIAAEIGYDGVELMGREPHLGVETTDQEARSLREHLDVLGLSVPCIASYTGSYVGLTAEECTAELDDLERFCELADILGADLVRHGPGGPPPYNATERHYEKGATWMQRAADRAEPYDTELVVEIHGNTLIESASDAVRLLDLIDRDDVGVIHDAGNMFICGNDYGRASIEVLGERLRHVHVKDERRVETADGPNRFTTKTENGTAHFEATRLGAGDIDHAAVVEALRATDYDGYLTDECHTRPTDEQGDISIAEYEFDALTRLCNGVDR